MIESVETLIGHTEDRVWHVSWSKDGKFLSSCGEDRVIRIWGTRNNDWEEADGIVSVSTLEEGQKRTIRLPLIFL
jgi:cytosolic iron-sulfur protein assembly protein CIAO1